MRTALEQRSAHPTSSADVSSRLSPPASLVVRDVQPMLSAVVRRQGGLGNEKAISVRVAPAPAGGGLDPPAT
jgi:hypothetical protein